MDSITDFERMMSERMPSMKEGIEAVPEGDKPWDSFETAEEQSEELRKRSAARRAESHRRWKASQDKDPEVRNYYGPDNDAKGSLNWRNNR